jgi:hypothetical protein
MGRVSGADGDVLGSGSLTSGANAPLIITDFVEFDFESVKQREAERHDCAQLLLVRTNF